MAEGHEVGKASLLLEGCRTLSEEDLFLLMARAHLPMPRLPESQTQEMVGDLTALLKRS